MDKEIIMCSTDYDIAEPYQEKIVRAKKQHICSECSREIKIGEKYQYIFGVWAGDANTYKTCSNCLIPQSWIRSECNGWLLGQLQDEILEHAHEYRKMFLYRWVIGMKNKWQSRLVQIQY